jgi:hypothetical protein
LNQTILESALSRRTHLPPAVRPVLLTGAALAALSLIALAVYIAYILRLWNEALET